MLPIVSSLITSLGKQAAGNRFDKSPIFIGGCGRSGTTLMLSILSAHPEVFACPRELNLFQDAQYRQGKLILPKFYRLYRTFIRERIPSTANRYCEKSPSNIYHSDLMDQLYGNNYRLIHMVRDGRDVTLSKHPKNKDAFWVDPSRWVKDVTIGLSLNKDPRVLMVKYEELILNFEQSITDICQFLGIPVVQEILNWYGHATVRQNRALFSSIGELHAASIEKWKDKRNLIRLEEFLAYPGSRELLERLNYL